mmetsp:Transcript_21227/g.33251  ORF Transcript_21227/g.33251 Transcript_21227/m.33251 type:complete len:111 (-) Transcript_21227:867-1199(-)
MNKLLKCHSLAFASRASRTYNPKLFVVRTLFQTQGCRSFKLPFDLDWINITPQILQHIQEIFAQIRLEGVKSMNHTIWCMQSIVDDKKKACIEGQPSHKFSVIHQLVKLM